MSARPSLVFPPAHHLLVTTPSCIFAWDASAVHPIFTSSKSGIVAAKETTDGSGILAVADQHCVVLHDTKRGQEKSWGLNADSDQVRHLEYDNSTKTLFLSTALTADIQTYATDRSRLLSPSSVHATPPNALAVSSTGHLIVSASDDPPTVYLRSLAHNAAPVLIEPRASSAAVTLAAFHPERPNIFLLGFRDGTLAAYDATKVLRKTQGSYSNQERINDGEVGHLENVHRTTSKLITQEGTGVKPTSITAAVFLPGYKTRAVSVSSDGRCRIVDFANGGVVVRTWHAKAPLSTVSILSVKARKEPPPKAAKRAVNTSSHRIGGPTSTNNLIAVGRADGKVHIYDSLGLLLAERAVSNNCERIISVEWIKLPSPKAIATKVPEAEASTVRPETQQASPNQAANKSRQITGLGLTPSLKVPGTTNVPQSSSVPRKFTIHPDEVDDEIEEGTVRHTPSPKRADVRLPLPPPTSNYLDLFSPIKPVEEDPEPLPKRKYSPSRIRPRISSQTFVQKSAPTPISRPFRDDKHIETPKPEGAAKERGLPTTLSSDHASPKAILESSTKTSPQAFKKQSTFLKPIRKSRKSMARAEFTPNDNAKVLADLRKISSMGKNRIDDTVPLPFSQPRQPVVKPRMPHKHHLQFPSLSSPAKQKHWDPGNVLERESTWPTDSMQDESLNENEDDIWLTSDTDQEGHNLRQRRLKSLQRPPARQASRTGVDNNGTVNTVPLLRSTEDEMFTAASHVSPSGPLSPSSDHVRDMFPRTSSLSPKNKTSPGRNRARSREARDRDLLELSPNATVIPKSPPGTKNPWAKMSAARQMPQEIGKVHNKVAQNGGQSSIANTGAGCENCACVNTKVNEMEEEMARLKGEVVMLKAALRRHGVPIPPGLLRRGA